MYTSASEYTTSLTIKTVPLFDVTSAFQTPTIPRWLSWVASSTSAALCCTLVWSDDSCDDVRPLATLGFNDAKIRFRCPSLVMSSNYTAVTQSIFTHILSTMNYQWQQQTDDKYAASSITDCQLLLSEYTPPTNETPHFTQRFSLPYWHYKPSTNIHLFYDIFLMRHINCSTTMVSPEPFPHRTRSLRCL